MSTLRTSSGSISLNVLEVAPPTLPSVGDLRFALEVTSTKLHFHGHSFWISARDFSEFSVSLRKLIERRKGAASLRAMSPGSFFIALKTPSPTRILVTINVNELSAGRDFRPRFAFDIQDEVDQEWLMRFQSELLRESVESSSRASSHQPSRS